MSRLNWGGFGLNAQRTGRTPFMKLAEGSAQLAEGVSFTEDTKAGVAAGFQSSGFVKPETVQLVERGRHAGPLVSPRSSIEFGVENNGASAHEMAQSLDMAPGALNGDEVVNRLGTGLYISNLWYTNFSDESAGRLTGMTRFATFWVERGEFVAPIKAMRFDDTIYRMFGSSLIELTQEREFILDPWSYDARATRSMHLPGALIEDMTFTL
jgi:predicted Zn-dependent protease